jgi:hypothetical protein
MGGTGGLSKMGVAAGCNGGMGGKGGDGGPGSNGLGGHAIGIAYSGDAPTLDKGSSIESTGTEGNGGTSAPTQEFPPK